MEEEVTEEVTEVTAIIVMDLQDVELSEHQVPISQEHTDMCIITEIDRFIIFGSAHTQTLK